MRDFDVIVIGGGHAGVEASFATARMGHSTLLLTLNKKMIANMPCNPHIGGSAKGVVVREIDALGGLMGKAADHHPLQIKMLNTGKGPGVQCLRSQQDKHLYPAYVQEVLESTPNLLVEEKEAVDFLVEGNAVTGVVTSDGEQIRSKAVILTAGTYLNSRVYTGQEGKDQGPDGQKASLHLSGALEKLGLELWRLKTGTPPRVKKSTIDFSKGHVEEGMDGELAFSYETKVFTPKSSQLPCFLIYTSDETLRLIKDNLDSSALFDGTINSNGPRYCPSIESKVVRFADKPRHQIFLEPEFEEGESFYIQGFSTAMPRDIQEKMVHSLPGLEHAEILKYAYQIEYDAVKTTEFDSTLRCKKYEGLYFAGQVCGTSGYEEAAGLGLVAGINAVLRMEGKPPFILKRNEAYIGVMIDDLVTKGIDEPYRLLSSRAEYRLLLRHDNADERLTEYGHRFGLISEERYASYLKKEEDIAKAIEILRTTNVTDRAAMNAYFVEMGYPESDQGWKGAELLKRPRFRYVDIARMMPELSTFSFSENDILSLETKVKYEGYLVRQEKEAKSLLEREGIEIPEDFDYLHTDGLRLEARQKLDAVKPKTIAQASRISGVNPADVSILLLVLRKKGL